MSLPCTHVPALHSCSCPASLQVPRWDPYCRLQPSSTRYGRHDRGEVCQRHNDAGLERMVVCQLL